MAMIASKGPDEEDDFPEASNEREVRSEVDDPRRSPAPREEEVVDWIWEAAKSFWHAIGNSQDPGTDWTTIFDSFTPDARSLSVVPLRRGSMIVVFQRAWTIPMRRALPSCF